MFLKIYFCLIFLIFIGLNKAGNLSKCVLPKGCQIQQVNDLINAIGNEKVAEKSKKGIRYDIFEGFDFDLDRRLKWKKKMQTGYRQRRNTI
jgi:hypothetical protein